VKTSIPRTFVACIFGLATYVLALGPRPLSEALGNWADYPHFRIGAELVGTGELYHLDAVYARQTQVFGMTYPALPPTRIPAYYLFLKPLIFFSVRTGKNIWLGAIVAAMCAVIALQLDGYRAPTTIAFFWCGATLFVILFAQDAAFSALGLVGFQRLRESKRPAWAGLALAAAMLPKPHLLIMVPLMLAVNKEWAPLRSCAVGLAVLGMLSFWAEGNWIMPWMRMATSTEANSSHVDMMPNLHGLAHWAGASSIWEIPGTLIIVVVAYHAAGAPSRLAILTTLISSLLISRHAYLADCLVLLPFLVGALSEIEWASGRLLALWILSPIPYLLALLGRGYILPLSLCALLFVIVCGLPRASTFARLNRLA
jgi:hypothetical protein